jgi:GAF domain-containing protein
MIIRKVFNPRHWSLRVRLWVAVAIPTLMSGLIAYVGLALFLQFNQLASSATLNLVSIALFFVFTVTVGLSVLVITLIEIFVLRPMRAVRFSIERLATRDFSGISTQLPFNAGDNDMTAFSESIYRLSRQIERDYQQLEQGISRKSNTVQVGYDVLLTGLTSQRVSDFSPLIAGLIAERYTELSFVVLFLNDPVGGETQLVGLGTQIRPRPENLPAIGLKIRETASSWVGRASKSDTTVRPYHTDDDGTPPINDLITTTQKRILVPIQINGQTVGVLDLHSNENTPFQETDFQEFERIAQSIARALETVQRAEENVRRIAELEAQTQAVVAEGWRRFSQRRSIAQQTISSDSLSMLQRQAIQLRQPVEKVEADIVRLAVPVTLRNQPVGAVEWELDRDTYDDSMKQLAVELTERLAVAAENVRLITESQQTARREQLLTEISAELTQQPDIASILQTAVRQLGQVLPVRQSTVRLTRKG